MGELNEFVKRDTLLQYIRKNWKIMVHLFFMYEEIWC
jgi:hypothetical protein